MIKFGPAGNSESFYDEGYKSSVNMPGWLSDMGLDAYEYQCGNGVNISTEKAVKIGEKAREHKIQLSIHSPYYINIANKDKQKQKNSLRYINQTLNAAELMGAKRIVVHSGSIMGRKREDALKTAREVLGQAVKQADESGFANITICPELMGKINQLGNLEEVIILSNIDERLIPCIDFGHLHARRIGGLNSQSDFKKVLDVLENKIGIERLRKLHIHFSRIEYTEKGGEKKHHTFNDIQYGPEFIYLIKEIIKRKMEPVVICESRGTMAEDALKMKKMYKKLL